MSKALVVFKKSGLPDHPPLRDAFIAAHDAGVAYYTRKDPHDLIKRIEHLELRLHECAMAARLLLSIHDGTDRTPTATALFAQAARPYTSPLSPSGLACALYNAHMVALLGNRAAPLVARTLNPRTKEAMACALIASYYQLMNPTYLSEGLGPAQDRINTRRPQILRGLDALKADTMPAPLAQHVAIIRKLSLNLMDHGF
ncbi:hypothetical protein [Micavibrio aeruginosavorus]|uniref:Uncharacterized protein n=1 Tax=Micavibrio aeruginosavorus EPB TaxID=349215 RepID=M4VUJ6_9BACT|nr:hypothetical protein [Micavibrio aeruginosavorus]AGH96884.1 hypothetical protein A11S_46 [Micavibrio aeruginosavorus EPB]